MTLVPSSMIIKVWEDFIIANQVEADEEDNEEAVQFNLALDSLVKTAYRVYVKPKLKPTLYFLLDQLRCCVHIEFGLLYKICFQLGLSLFRTTLLLHRLRNSDFPLKIFF